jgi:RNA polymerase sigma-70 factor, ECF subfamily
MTVVLSGQPRAQPPADDGEADAALVAAILGGQGAAPARAWRRYAPLVRRIVRRTLGPRADVEDTVQDVFLVLFTKLPGLREPTALRAFVVSIAVRVLKSELRRRRIRRVMGLAAPHDLVELKAVGPDALARQALTRFYGILDTLSARERTAFVLRHVEEMPEPQVASAMNLSQATVRRLCQRAYARISERAESDLFLADLLPPLRSEP